MASSVDTAAILKNVVAETCVPALETDFFSAIARSGPPPSPAHARRISKDVVDAEFSKYVCTGNMVPAGEFNRLLRVCNFKGFASSLPAAEREDLFERFSVTDDDLENVALDRLRDIIDAYVRPGAFVGPLRIRGKDDIAWVSDRDVFPTPLPEWHRIVNQLGLSHYASYTAGVVFVYLRAGTPHDLHVPRVFEGIDWPPFKLEIDCTADRGQTGPTGGEPQRPEAVHRGFDIPPAALTLIASG